MGYLDLRSFIDALRREGELAEVDAPVDPAWEINGVTNKVMREQGPAVLFKNVRGTDMPVLTGALATERRLAIALGTRPDADERELRSAWWRRIDQPFKPAVITSGPSQEVVLAGAQVDLGVLPEIIWHSGDAAPYFGTLGLQVTQHPDTMATNVGIYRMRALGAAEATFYAPPYQHAGIHLTQWEQRGLPMPAAVVFGAAPAVTLAAGTKFQQPPDEYDVAGGLQRQPLELVRCITSDLLVPAQAEIVLEGEVECGRREICGPFGEYTGFYGDAMPAPVFRLKAITHRSSPIFQATREGKSPNESSNIWIKTRSFSFARQVLELPGVRDAALTGAAVSFHAVISVRQDYPGQVRQLASCLLGGDFGNLKQITFVDEDVDVNDLAAVARASALYVDPVTDVQIYTRHRGGSLDVSQIPSHRLIGGKVIIDATRAWHHADTSPTGSSR